jgi:hypothetical protein
MKMTGHAYAQQDYRTICTKLQEKAHKKSNQTCVPPLIKEKEKPGSLQAFHL